MPFYEVIYETGSHSVLNAENDEAVVEGLKQQHERAKNGMRGQLEATSSKHPSHDEMHGADTPVPVATHAAERVAKVLVYDNHPGEDAGRITDKGHAHDSNYAATESHELDLNEWGLN